MLVTKTRDIESDIEIDLGRVIESNILIGMYRFQLLRFFDKKKELDYVMS